ncbi:MAG: hypothetical protein ACRDPZ_03520 [Gaiellaceae bacterium]
MTPRTLATGCGIVVVLAVLVGGCGLAVAISSLPSGELPDVDFHGDDISASRAAVVPELEAQLDSVEDRFGAGHVGSRGRIDRCEAGQDNFTRQDRYAYTCHLEVVQLMAVPEPFAVEASRLGEALLEGDCQKGTDTDRALAEPVSHPRQLDASSGACAPAASFSPRIMRWLSVPPTADDVQLAEIYLRPDCRTASIRRGHCDSDPLDLRTLAAVAPPDAAYLAIVVAEEQYSAIPWDCPWPASWLRERCRA